ncbi:MAG: serine protease [Brevundimonas sp.]|nr:MAG: serine protease [Brevundimonas sp.]
MSDPSAQLPVSEQLPSVTVRIRTKGFSDRDWTGVGTGFVWVEKLANGGSATFLITNRHVLKDATVVGLTLQGTAPDGSRASGPGREVATPLGELHIIYHSRPEVDLALLALGPIFQRLNNAGFHPHFASVGRDIIPSAAQIRDLSAAHPVTVVGYPNGVFDEANNLPVVRRGTTAIPPWIDYQGNKDLLLDIAVFGGSSGSPVFVLDEGFTIGRAGFQLGSSQLYLMGVLKAGHYQTELGTIIQIPAPTAMISVAEVDKMINLAVCVKSEQVVGLIDQAIAQFKLTPAPSS